MSEDYIKREDAIKALEDYLGDCYRVSRRKYEKTMLDAISMDFDAVLKDIPSADVVESDYKGKQLQAVYDHGYEDGYNKGRKDGYNTAQAEAVMEEREKGMWIPCSRDGLPLTELLRREGTLWYGYKCSKCNFIFKGNALIQSPYCQVCGAKMTSTFDNPDNDFCSRGERKDNE